MNIVNKVCFSFFSFFASLVIDLKSRCQWCSQSARRRGLVDQWEVENFSVSRAFLVFHLTMNGLHFLVRAWFLTRYMKYNWRRPVSTLSPEKDEFEATLLRSSHGYASGFNTWIATTSLTTASLSSLIFPSLLTKSPCNNFNSSLILSHLFGWFLQFHLE